MNSIPLTYVLYFLSIEGHLGYFHFLGIVKKSKINIYEQISVERVLTPLGISQGMGHLVHFHYTDLYQS